MRAKQTIIEASHELWKEHTRKTPVKLHPVDKCVLQFSEQAQDVPSDIYFSVITCTPQEDQRRKSIVKAAVT